MESSFGSIKNVRFFSIIFLFCFLLPFFHHYIHPFHNESPILVGGFNFMICYMPYIILKFIGFLFLGFKWPNDTSFKLIPITTLIIIYFIELV